MKRFWDRAEVATESGGYGVLLDGKPLRIPQAGPLLVPTARLAEAIAAEWQDAGATTREMEYSDVPLTRLAGTAQYRILPDPAPNAASIATYGESDLLCYRAMAPRLLVDRQITAWTPLLDWVRVELGAALITTEGIIHQPQHPAALAALRRAVDAQGPWRLAGLGIVVPALGSLVLGLAIAHGRLDASSAHELALIDETYQAELWGEDDLAMARRANVEADLLDAARFMALCR